MDPRGMHALGRSGAVALAVALALACGEKPKDATPGKEAGASPSPGLAARGAALQKSRGCAMCHSLDGSQLAGPTYAGLYNSTVELRDGSTAIADDEYIRASILEPAKQFRKGFDQAMPSYAGMLSDEEVDALVAFIRELPKPAGP